MGNITDMRTAFARCDLLPRRLAILCLLAILLPQEGNTDKCIHNIMEPGCPCGEPLGSKRYMLKNGVYGCFTCVKGERFDTATSQCQLCTGFTSCKDNVSPNACDQRYCENDETTTRIPYINSTTTFTTTTPQNPGITTTPSPKQTSTVEPESESSSNNYRITGDNQDKHGKHAHKPTKKPIPDETDNLPPGAFIAIAIAVLLTGSVVIFILGYRKCRKSKIPNNPAPV